MSGHFYLVGFMGAGKSTVGAILAGRTGRPFVDLDPVIERAEGRSIRDIFDQDGEETFRMLESRELRNIMDDAPSVVACGGGIVGDPVNVGLMSETGAIVYLKIDIDSVIDRIPDDDARPLLGDRGQMEALFEERKALYEAVADVVVSTTGKSPDRVADEVLEATGASS